MFRKQSFRSDPGINGKIRRWSRSFSVHAPNPSRPVSKRQTAAPRKRPAVRDVGRGRPAASRPDTTIQRARTCLAPRYVIATSRYTGRRWGRCYWRGVAASRSHWPHSLIATSKYGTDTPFIKVKSRSRRDQFPSFTPTGRSVCRARSPAIDRLIALDTTQAVSRDTISVARTHTVGRTVASTHATLGLLPNFRDDL